MSTLLHGLQQSLKYFGLLQAKAKWALFFWDTVYVSLHELIECAFPVCFKRKFKNIRINCIDKFLFAVQYILMLLLYGVRLSWHMCLLAC